MKFCIYLCPVDILKSIYLPNTGYDKMWVLLQLVQMPSLGAFSCMACMASWCLLTKRQVQIVQCFFKGLSKVLVWGHYAL